MIAEAHRNQKRFIVRADDKLTAFMELEAAVYPRLRPSTHVASETTNGKRAKRFVVS